MSDKIYFPVYRHSILGISNSILKSYGVTVQYETLPILDRELAKNYKNVVLWILDGLGLDLIKHLLSPKAFLRQHIRDQISSVFPPTTAAATTTYYSGLPPAVHGWIGWSPYFKDYRQSIELFTGLDTYTHEKTDMRALSVLPYQHIFQKITNQNPDVCCQDISPEKIQVGGAKTFQEQCQRITRQIKKKGRQFILAYWPEPDHTCHHEGTYVDLVKNQVRMINEQIKRTCQKAENTLFIISADHGHIPVHETTYIDEYPDITDCLDVPLNLDDRVSAIFLKKGKEKDFLRVYQTYFQEDFCLIKSEEAIKKHLFGFGPLHPKIKDFIGDYLLIATGNRVLRQRVGNFVSGPEMKSSHAGLTEKEMVVPLMVIGKGKKAKNPCN